MAAARLTPHRWGLERWEPFREMERMLESMERFAEEVFGRPMRRRRTPVVTEWVPSIEMFEKGDEFVVRAELPGVHKKDVHVSVTDDVLTIRGERKREEEVKEEDYHHCESLYGSFHRAVSLPLKVEGEKVKASFKDGILEIRLPKAKEILERAREIKIE